LIGLAIISPLLFIVSMFEKDKRKERRMDELREDLEKAERELVEAEKRNDPDMVIFWAKAKEGIEKKMNG